MYPCYFYTPALRIDSVAKTGARAGVMQVLDLEDSIPSGAKTRARECLAAADLSATGVPGVILRINSLETPEGLADIRMLLDLGGEIGGVPVETVFVPKVAAGRDIAICRSLLSALPEPPQIAGVIETVDAVENAFDIAAASDGLGFGQADLVSEMYAPDESYLAHARARLCVAAARHGLPAVDTNSFELWDAGVIRAESEAAKRCGFTGKAAIHPRQVDIIVETFSVGAAELDDYRRTIKDYESDANGFAVSKDRVLAPPFVAKAQRMLALFGAGSSLIQQPHNTDSRGGQE
jgi:citrate lyase subunit beta/citryl-CoA lyase/(S)-citramalyl-CoA lyase